MLLAQPRYAQLTSFARSDKFIKYEKISELGIKVRVAALQLASTNGHLYVVKYLVLSGTNIYTRNYYALELARRGNHQDVFKYLAIQLYCSTYIVPINGINKWYQ